MTDDAWQGPRFVLLLYGLLVGVSGVFGYVIGLIRPEDLEPSLFMLVDLPPTPAGMALYGMVTVATILGLLLVAVWYVARNYDPREGPTEKPD